MHRTRAALAALLLGACAPVPIRPPSASIAPEWARGTTCYEIFVRSFADSDGDGVGDLNGLTARLDYLNDGVPEGGRDLGVRCIWLMPVAESPSYHGYDVADYYAVDREYGTAADFRRLVAEAHRRGIRVLVDLVLNHASSEHPAFQAALADPTSPYRDWFIFRPTDPGVLNAWGGNNWHRSPVRDEYYYGFFWRGMPDLNLENPAVRAETMRIADFWLGDMGVDGFRLDAVKFLVERGNDADDTPGTHAFLREFRTHLRQQWPDAFTIGEVWDSTGRLLDYYPNQLDGYFAFEVADSILAAVRNGSAQSLLAPVLRLQGTIAAWRWSPFLRNHDQPRTLTVLGGDRARARLAAALLLTLPGLPFVYYGEEIGMTGDKPDELIRTPMQWDASAGGGFTGGTPWQALNADWQSNHVAAQDTDPASLLNLYRRLIHARANHRALGTGELVPLQTADSSVVGFLRQDGDDAVLVVANLGEVPRARAWVTLAAGALAPATYQLRDLLGDESPPPLSVARTGGFRGYVPVAELAPLQLYLFELTRRSP